MDLPSDPGELQLLTESLGTAMGAASGARLDAALTDLGWRDMLDEIPELAIPLVFRLLGETGAHAPVLNDVVLRAAGKPVGGITALPFSGNSWVRWRRDDTPGSAIDESLPIHPVAEGDSVFQAGLDLGRQALGWWLVGASRAMLTLARQHALDRVQFGRHISSFQAIRHRLAETLVAIEGAVATLQAAAAQPEDPELASLLAKAAAGQAAQTAARHCQQVLGGIGFTAEHPLHRHIKRSLVLDSLLGSARELTGQAGAALRVKGFAPRLLQL
ncbi:acyl-CoA dehydrogenase family protein [Mycobacterium sherrisii]|uniref:acyl-CoA dehydrogenase family protein n=1 Tax=Mycobacterium sherrisii TaxID=243061 RepID=UPI000A14CFBE|nr:acyl-CoA dehydrogenase family protein [Mycobacterium sherrisii]MCV7031812.1 acyl-CoA dehydrogenase [Mycobacterium sherrisii]MEC4762964.1 acyl-CoA dehydrogenase family protein [Mycobacterium sherrisii]ORW86254.1 acyl-CoA dehydrogenase [Mycobacterium sherrisii]